MIINDDSFQKLWHTTMDRRNLLGQMTTANGGEWYYLSGVLDTCRSLHEQRTDKPTLDTNEETNT